MSSPAISIRNLDKRYCVNRVHDERGYRTLRESVARAASAPLRRLRGKGQRSSEPFWALKDIDLDIQAGEVLGIIGRNGAGKSTLLKILSRITKPSRGEVQINGRVGSLLEVGTGFHPELTGRENIYMNGAVLGMSRAEIRRNFDAIVDFAEVELFLDTPVKRYSSGMYVRLAFAVAAHLEPEIIIVDEVLAVGDFAFQRKCLGRMRDVTRKGRTVLFVSHNMAAVESLCQSAVLLEAGRMAFKGPVRAALREYNSLVFASAQRGCLAAHRPSIAPERKEAFQFAELLDEDGDETPHVPLGGVFRLRLGLKLAAPVDSPTIGIGFDDAAGQRVLTVHTPASRGALGRIEGPFVITCRIPQLPLAPGDYWLKLALSSDGVELESVERAVSVHVADGDAYGEGRGHTRGVCVAPSYWQLTRTDEGWNPTPQY